MSYQLGNAKVWDGTEWVEAEGGAPGAAAITGTTGSPTETTITDGGVTYDVYQFTGSGSITVGTAGFAELLLVGGGASGGAGIAAGGGAGGHLSIASAYLPAGALTVTVGAGGAAAVVPANDTPLDGQNGFGSRIGDYVSPGGGAGSAFVATRSSGNYRAGRGHVGGSGGGASGWLTGSSAPGGGVSVAGLGNSGGIGANSLGAGGGGGAGTAGSDGVSNAGGNGGNGLANSITGTSVTRAGGGGGAGDGGTYGSGGTGGGGDAANNPGISGDANTGGGGGASRVQDTSSTSGSGGSGIVIVRVAV